MALRLRIAAALASVSLGATAHASQWVPAWGAAQMLAGGADADRIAATGPATIRETVHLSASGATVRVRLSNVAGDQPLRIGGAAIARGMPGRAAVTDSHALRFGGAASVVIPAGAEVYSDAVPLAVAAGGDLAVSLYLPDPVAHRTGHPGARATTFLAGGDATGAADLPGAQRIGGWWNLADIEVDGSPQTGTIVAIGDSITDGHGVSDDSNARWPDVLARRLAADPATRRLSVVNAGIGGNRVLRDGLGPNLLARFDRDVIARPGVRYAILLEGVNDLGVLTREHPATPEEHRAIVAAIIGAYAQVAARAHEHGIRLIGGTITPYGGSDYYHPGPESEADRQAINAFIRKSATFDGVVDFDRALRDPAHPDRLLPAYDSGDHLHPGEAGYRAMAAAVPLTLFADSTPAKAGAQLGDASNEALTAIPSDTPTGLRPSPGWRSVHTGKIADLRPTRAKPQIALTFDDIPAHGPLPVGGDRVAIARSIVATLAAHHTPAFGFYNGGFARDPRSPEIVALWRRAGLPLGNHGWSHGNLDAMGAPAFLADVARDEPALETAGRGSDWHWFRYPFLAEGRDPAARDAVRAGLAARGYRIAAVTMSFGDYAWNDAYARCVAHHDTGAIAGLETGFLAAATRQAIRARALAQGALGRDIPYVLLMHLGAFDARMLPRLLSLYRTMGFGFTTLAAAEADPFYAAATDLSLTGPSPTLEAAARDAGRSIPAAAPLPGPEVCA